MWLDRRRIVIALAQAASIAVLLVAWELLARFGILPQFLVSPPSVVFLELPRILFTPEVAHGLISTLMLVGIGVSLATLIGLFIGFVIGNITFLQRVLESYIVAFYALPKVTLLPFFWILFGLALEYRLAYGALEGIFPVMLNVIFAAKSIDPSLIKMAKSVGVSSRQMYLKIVLPSTVPSMMGGIRIGFIATFIGVILAEMFAGNDGVGYLIRRYTDIFATSNLYGLIVVVVIVGTVINVFLLQVERRLTRWKQTGT